MEAFFIRNKKGQYLYQLGEKLIFKKGLMLTLAYKTEKDALEFAKKNIKEDFVIESIKWDD